MTKSRAPVSLINQPNEVYGNLPDALRACKEIIDNDIRLSNDGGGYSGGDGMNRLSCLVNVMDMLQSAYQEQYGNDDEEACLACLRAFDAAVSSKETQAWRLRQTGLGV
jgi:hypothetical protein